MATENIFIIFSGKYFLGNSSLRYASKTLGKVVFASKNLRSLQFYVREIPPSVHVSVKQTLWQARKQITEFFSRKIKSTGYTSLKRAIQIQIYRAEVWRRKGYRGWLVKPAPHETANMYLIYLPRF